MPATRGVIYMKWGASADQFMQRSMESLKKHHPELPVHVVELPANATLLDKSRMMEVTDFDLTLFLDIDTIVMDRLDFGFGKAEKFALACCICECPWARRYGGLSGDMIEYNTGVLFFSKQAKPVFDLWKQYAPTLDSSIIFKRPGQTELFRMPFNDQGSFAKAIEDSGFNPYILPLNWNLRPAWQPMLCGQAKIWHDYSTPPSGLEPWNARQGLQEKVIDFVRVRDP